MNTSIPSRKFLAAGAMVLASCVAVVALMHTKAARPLLSAIGIHCPVDEASGSDVATAQARGFAALRGSSPAPARPGVASMPLGQFAESDALRWAAMNHAHCEIVVKGLRFLRCRGVDGNLLGVAGPPISELWLSFGLSGKLIGVDVYRRGLDAQGEMVAWADATDRLKSNLGEPTAKVGDASPKILSATAYSTARVQYRYADYLATVTAIYLPYAGLAVREQYISNGS